MKSKEFLKEWAPSQSKQRAEDDDETNALMQEIAHIGKQCKPYLSQVQDPLSLYRGVDAAQPVIKKRIRLEDREPLGMVKRIQGLVNKFFTKKFGAPFRFSALCTGEEWVATGFGEVYIIFPIGDYEFLWANDVEDLNEHFWRYEEQLGDSVEYSDIVQFLSSKDYRRDDINSAIASGKEIMLRAEGYYGIHLDDVRGKEDKILAALKAGTQK